MANSKLTGLSATTTPVSTDIFYIVTDPGGTPTSLKVTGANMGKALTMVGKVTVTQPASSATLTLLDGGTNAFTSSASIPKYSTDTTGAVFEMVKARGTGTTTIVTGDVLGDINFYGHDGSNSLNMARIRAVSTGTIASTRVPTALEFYTATNAAPSVLTKALTLGTDQSATFTNKIVVSPTANSPSLIEIRTSTGNKSVQLGVYPTDSSYHGIWLGNITPSATNFSFLNDNTGTALIFNAALGGALYLQVANTSSAIVNANGLSIGDTVGVGGASKFHIKAVANTAYWTGTGYSITGSGTTSMISHTGTLNTSGVVDLIKVDITNATSSGAGSTFLNFLDSSSSKFSVGVQGNVISAGSIKSGAPSGGTAQPWKLGTVASVSPTAQNRTIEVEVNGTTYYLTAKTTND